MSSLNRFNFPSKEPLSIRSHHTLPLIDRGLQVGSPPDSLSLYKKPAEICQLTDIYLKDLWRNPESLHKKWKEDIEQRIAAQQLRLKKMEASDTAAIRDFLFRRYNAEMAQEICAFDLFRFRNFGHGILLLDTTGKVRGTIFEVAYAAELKTSYTIRLAIDETCAGLGLGQDLMQYSCLTAMESGAKVKRGIIQVQNLQSLHINLNKVGWICDKFEEDVNGLGAFFHIVLPLDMQGLTGNRIDFSRCKAYLAENRPGIDYRLLDSEDLEGIARMYEETDFIVVALLKAGEVSLKPSFLALPAKDLGLNT